MSAKLHFKYYNPKQILLFPPRVDEFIAENDPVRMVDAVVESLNLNDFKKLYSEQGSSPYNPKMMLKVIIYAYMNNVYSCRKIEKLLMRDTHYIWLAGYNKPDFITINRFRNRVKKEINGLFTQLVLLLAERGFVSLDVAYIDGTKMESKANKYTFVWRKSVERNRAKLMERIRALLKQIDEAVAQDNAAEAERVEFTPEGLTSLIDELKEAMKAQGPPQSKEQQQQARKRTRQIKEVEEMRDKLEAYDRQAEQIGERGSMSKTDPDATFMHMKEDSGKNAQSKPGYNLQIATENQFITDFALCCNRADTLTMIPFLNSFHGRYGHLPKVAVADSGYGSEENYRFMDEAGIRAFVKYSYFDKEHRPRYKPNPFHHSSLHYDPSQDCYTCPKGQRIERVGTSVSVSANGYRNESARYRAANCRGCPLRESCYKSASDQRSFEVNHRLERYKKKASELLTSEEGTRHCARRSIEPESVFGQMKNNMAYRRFRHFGKDKATMDLAFFSIAFNIKKMCSTMAKMA